MGAGAPTCKVVAFPNELPPTSPEQGLRKGYDRESLRMDADAENNGESGDTQGN